MKKYALLLLFLNLVVGVSIVNAQTKVIRGVVTDANDGNTLPGVSVVVKGTTIGVTTGIDGDYTVNAPAKSTVLVFSYVGMITQEISIDGRNKIDVKMVPDVVGVEEIVVTGVGIATDKRKVAISVESVKGDQLTDSPTSTFDQALAGKVPGAVIQSVSGQPGQQQSIVLRSINSLSSTQPMILVDGVQINTDQNYNGSTGNLTSRLADIDFSDVEHVEVVQGAAAATIYGAQGANGVIQIFTKKGKKGKMSISLKVDTGWDSAILNGYEKSKFHHYDTTSDGFIAAPGGGKLAQDANGRWPAAAGTITPATIVDKPFKEQIYNNVEEIFRSAASENYSVSVNGGAGNVTYLVSGSRLTQESIIFGEVERINFRANLGIELANNLTFTTRSNLITSKNNTGTITGRDNVHSSLGSAFQLPQYVNMSFKDPIGNFVAKPFDGNSTNPLYSQDVRKYSSDLDRVIQNFGLEYKLNKYIRFDAKYGIDRYTNLYQEFLKNQEDYLSNAISPISGRLRQYRTRGTTQNGILNTYVVLDFKEDLGFNIPLKSSTQISGDWRKETFNRVVITGTGVPKVDELNFNLSQTNQKVIDEEYDSSFTTYGFLINEKLDFGNIFGVSGGVRIDWSSAFGAGSDPFVFPRGDAYLRVSEFGFMENAKDLISEWKVRAAYGEAGIQPNALDRIRTLNVGTIGDKSNTYIKDISTNPDLDVEVSKEIEFGTDFLLTTGQGAWFKYLKGSFTYYNRKTEGSILSDPDFAIETPPSTGSGGIIDNAFDLEADGFQFSLNTSIFKNEKFSWDFGLNFNTSKSSINKISNGESVVVEERFVLEEGAEIGTFTGKIPLTSIDQVNPDGVRYIPEGSQGDYVVSSTGYVVNRDTKEVVLTSDKYIIGKAFPDFTLTFNNSFSFAEVVSFSFQIDWFKGLDIYNQTKQWQYRDLTHKDVAVPVTIGAETAAFAKYYQSLYSTNDVNAAFIEDGSFIRLRNVNLTFHLKKLLGIRWGDKLNLTLSGRNLITITDYSGLDPEAAAVNANSFERGLDEYAFPNTKSVHVALKFDF